MKEIIYEIGKNRRFKTVDEWEKWMQDEEKIQELIRQKKEQNPPKGD